MTSIPKNHLSLFIKNGKLIEDLSAHDDNALRLALMMMMDNLERYSEAAGLIQDPAEKWFEYNSFTSEKLEARWKEQLEAWDNPQNDGTYAERDPKKPWLHYQGCQSITVSDNRFGHRQGSIIHKSLDELNRKELENELKTCAIFYQHIFRAFERMEAFVNIMRRGQWYDFQNPLDQSTEQSPSVEKTDLNNGRSSPRKKKTP